MGEQELSVSLDSALKSVTYDMVRNIEEGETIQLNKDYSMYRYMMDPNIVVIIDNEEWEEYFVVLYSTSDKSVTFDTL